MHAQNKVSGVVLAGGQAKRMQQQDKGLLLLNGRPLVSYTLAAMLPLVDELMISANRNQMKYSQFGYPIVADQSQNFQGPLAGILAAMQVAEYPLLLVAPCDTPLLQSQYLLRLLNALTPETHLSIAFDGERMHPVCMAVKTQLYGNLYDFLKNGGRKMQHWVNQQQSVQVDLSDVPEIFININTPTELDALEENLKK
ncbi:molybdenum cofactor guanylyltransferase MobA [Methylomonas sp. AM2-LC]|uniref:molybdenum cofactor guanylyltransferase MobA n=1 Tax=Methylomonas sp. AM2-LC TaxID=3153301 RepID=UPI00326775E2